MPWSNQNGGGGPWGGGGGGNNQGGGGGPWGQGPNRPRGGGGGNGGPPDLEEIIRRSQDRFKNVLPGGFNGGAGAIVGAADAGAAGAPKAVEAAAGEPSAAWTFSVFGRLRLTLSPNR